MANQAGSQKGGENRTGEEVHSPQLSELTAQQSGNEENKNLSRILDIPVTVSVEIGRTRMVINELLQLGHGSIVELEKLSGEPMEILVNDRLVARGEVVVVNEKFGVRLTDIISPMERIKQLKK